MAAVKDRTEEMCILVNDPGAQKKLFTGFKHTHYTPDVSCSEAEQARDVFIISTAIGLVDVADAVHKANSAHRLRALLIHEDKNQDWVTRMLDHAGLRTLRNLLVHSSWDIPKRVLTAWKYNVQTKLIADAAVFDDQLFILDCALNSYNVAFDKIRALSKIPRNERHQFEVSEDGSHISWDSQDVDLNLESIHVAIDPAAAAQAEARRLAHDELFGSGIASLRKRNRLKQSDVVGLSERQLRRIESGEHASVKSLEYLAQAHKLSLRDYLNAVAEQVKQLRNA